MQPQTQSPQSWFLHLSSYLVRRLILCNVLFDWILCPHKVAIFELCKKKKLLKINCGGVRQTRGPFLFWTFCKVASILLTTAPMPSHLTSFPVLYGPGMRLCPTTLLACSDWSITRHSEGLGTRLYIPGNICCNSAAALSQKTKLIFLTTMTENLVMLKRWQVIPS